MRRATSDSWERAVCKNAALQGADSSNGAQCTGEAVKVTTSEGTQHWPHGRQGAVSKCTFGSGLLSRMLPCAEPMSCTIHCPWLLCQQMAACCREIEGCSSTTSAFTLLQQWPVTQPQALLPGHRNVLPASGVPWRFWWVHRLAGGTGSVQQSKNGMLHKPAYDDGGTVISMIYP